jgi:hypothetical protein
MTQAEGPEAAPWLTEYLHELAVFPNGKHDDQADSTAQFLDWFKTPFIGQNMYELLRREAEAAEQRRKPQPTKTVYAPGSEPEDSLPVSKRLAAFCRLPAGAKRIRTLSPTRARRSRQPQGSLLTPALEGDGFEPSVPLAKQSVSFVKGEVS